MAEYLIRLQPHDGVTLRTVYVGTIGHHTDAGDDPANVYFEPRVVDPGNIEQHLFAPGSTRGRNSVANGDIILARLDAGNGESLDEWIGWDWKGRAISIWRWDGVSRVVDSPVAFRGVTEQLFPDEDTHAITIHDRLADLDKPVLVETWAGTTTSGGMATADGNADLAGKLKQRLWGGPNYAVPCEPADAYELVYSVNGGHPVQSIAAFDGGLAVTVAADYASLVELKAATIPAGDIATCRQIGMFRAANPPFFGLAADVTEGTSAGVRTVAQVVRRILNEFIAAYSLDLTFDDASFAAFDAASSAECHVTVTGADTALSICQRLLDSAHGWIIVDANDRIVIGQMPAIEGVAVLSLDDTQTGDFSRSASGDTDGGEPAGRVTVRYAQVLAVQTGADLDRDITTERKALIGTEWRSVTVENAAVLAINPKAPTITVDTQLTTPADAGALTDYLLAFYSPRRRIYSVPVPDVGEIMGVGVGARIELVRDDLDFTAGKPGVLLGRVLDLEDDAATLEVMV